MKNEIQPINLLLIEDNEADINLVKHLLKDDDNKIHLFYVQRLEEAKKILSVEKIDIILLDLNLSDSIGLQTFVNIKPLIGTIPVIIYSVITDKDISIAAMKEGAQDFLIKNSINSELLSRAIIYAIERQKIAEQLSTTTSQYLEILEKDPYATIIVQDNEILFGNAAFKKLINFSEDFINKKMEEFFSQVFMKEINKHFNFEKLKEGDIKFECRMETYDNRFLDLFLTIAPLNNNKIQIIFQDIAQLNPVNEQIKNLAYCDPLTGVNNRNQLYPKIKSAIQESSFNNCFVGIVYLDIDDFKQFNDNYGHDFGDNLLKIIVKRLLNQIRSEDSIIRVGGDEFVLVFKNLENREQIKEILQTLTTSFNKKFFLNNIEVKATISLGVSLYPDHGDNIKKLLIMADKALYEVKKTGKNRFKIYSDK